MKAPSKLV